MKKLIILSVLAALCFTNCGRKKHTSKKAKEGRIEIVPFYVNRVTIQDLHEIDTNQYYIEPQEFLDKEQYNLFKNAVKSMMSDPKAKVYAAPDYVFTAEELRSRYAFCDSVMESSLDVEGHETITKSFRCDSTSILNNLSVVNFYETWYINSKTHLIEKETLGFAVWNYVKEKEAFREIFLVFKDEEARQKCKRYYLTD